MPRLVLRYASAAFVLAIIGHSASGCDGSAPPDTYDYGNGGRDGGKPHEGGSTGDDDDDDDAPDGSHHGPSGNDGGAPFAGRGMNMPWFELQAEDGDTNATILGPSRTKWDANHIEAEAIGRRAVRLEKTGDYVSFKTTAASNSIVLRFCIPDSPGGGGIEATLGLYVDGKRRDLHLDSHHSWTYLGATIPGPNGPNIDAPGAQPHMFFDETRLLLDEIPAGSVVTLKRDAQDNASYYVLDLVDFEEVPPPLTMPDGFTSVESFDVHPDDGVDHAEDIRRALKTTKKLWFPKGKYVVDSFKDGSIGIGSPGAEIRGAGMWYTELHGSKALFWCDGQVRCVFGDFAIFGKATSRNEEQTGVPQKAFNGDMGVDSLIENIWIEHEVSALRIGDDPPFQKVPTQWLTVQNVRIRDMYADGINISNGTTGSRVSNCHIRNTGDDAAVVWSIKWTDWVRDLTFTNPNAIPPNKRNEPDQGVARDNLFENVSVQMPWRGPCFAAYGGQGNHWKNNTCEDVLTYPGIYADHEFSPYDYGPDPTTFESITVTRAGGDMFHEADGNPWQHGAIKFYMREGSVNNILVKDVDVIDPTYMGIEFRGYGTALATQYGEAQGTHPALLAAADKAKLGDVYLQNVTVRGAGTFGIQVVDNGGRGGVAFENVAVTDAKKGGLDKGGAPDSFFDRRAGNTGW